MSRLVSGILVMTITMVGVVGCMRLDPDHPYDPDSPPKFRAPASLISTIYTPEAPDDFDYSVFLVKLTAAEYEGVYTRRPAQNGTFRFEGLPPGIYRLSVPEVDIDNEPFGIEAEEILLPVGERVSPDFYRLDRL